MREGWVLARLDDVARQCIEPVVLQPGSEYQSLGVRWYGAGTFLRDPKLGSEIKAKRLFRVHPGQFVYNRMFVTEGSFGVVRVEDENAVASNEFPVFDLDENQVLTEFLLLHFQRPEVWAQVATEATGTTKSRRRWKEEQFLNYRVAIPPLEKQRRIVDLVGSVDGAIEMAEASMRNLVMTGERVRDQLPRADYVPIGTILESIDSGVSTKLVEGAGPRSTLLTLAAIRPASFSSREIKDIGVAPMPSRARLSEGDLLITRSNTPDRVGYVARARDVVGNSYFPDLVWRLILDESRISKEYLEQVLSSPTYRTIITSMASGTSESMRKINKATFSTIEIPLPSMLDQEDYVAPLTAVRSAQRTLRENIDDLRSLRSKLLSSLLTGEQEIPESYDEFLEVVTA